MKQFHPDELALLASIHAGPRDDTPRLIYADWLEEHDQPEFSEYIRVWCRHASARIASREQADLRIQAAGLILNKETAWFGPLHQPPLLEFNSNLGWDKGLPVVLHRYSPDGPLLPQEALARALAMLTPRHMFALEIDAARRDWMQGTGFWNKWWGDNGEGSPVVPTAALDRASRIIVTFRSGPRGLPPYLRAAKRLIAALASQADPSRLCHVTLRYAPPAVKEQAAMNFNGRAPLRFED